MWMTHKFCHLINSTHKLIVYWLFSVGVD